MWSQEGDQWSQMISNALRSAVGEGGLAELERERRIGEPRGDDKVEDGAGVVSGERGGGLGVQQVKCGGRGAAWVRG